jgi:two-component system, NarL family, nitrate/nitrite response regulator NarL
MIESGRVLIADDHALLRSGVRMALEAEGFTVVAEAADGRAAIAHALRTRPDLCVVDLSMPGGGIETIRELNRLLPASRVVVLTASASEEDMFAALGAGAAGFVPKGTASDRLPAILRGVLDGEAALPRRLTAKLIEEFRRRRVRRPMTSHLEGEAFATRLTEREMEVLELLADGQATSQIGGELGISDVTVRRHVSAIVHKVGVADRSSAVRLVRESRGSVL